MQALSVSLPVLVEIHFHWSL